MLYRNQDFPELIRYLINWPAGWPIGLALVSGQLEDFNKVSKKIFQDRKPRLTIDRTPAQEAGVLLLIRRINISLRLVQKLSFYPIILHNSFFFGIRIRLSRKG